MKKSKNSGRIKLKTVSLVLLLIFLDFITKRIFEIHNFSIIPDFLSVNFVKNTGASWGILPGQNFLLIIISIIVLCLLIKWKKEFSNKLSFILIISGTLGNLIDRILYGGVTDFIAFNFFPTFNLADSYLTIGIIILIMTELLPFKTLKFKRKKQLKHKTKPE